MNQLLKYTLILVFLQFTMQVVAQNYTLSYRVLDSEDGLLGSRVNSFHQDKDGFNWIGTQRGIARYDGHRFQWFTKTNSHLRGLPGKDKLVEDDEGYLWSVVIDKIDLINTRTLEIQSLEDKIGAELPFKGRIEKIIQTKDNYIFIKSNKSTKWYRYHSSTGFQALDFLPEKFRFIEIEGDKIWVHYYDNRLEAYHYKTGKKLKKIKIEGNRTFKVIKNYTLGKDMFWSVNNNTLEIWELHDENAQKIYSFKNQGKKPDFREFVFYLPKSNLLVTNFDGIALGIAKKLYENGVEIAVSYTKETKEDVLFHLEQAGIKTELTGEVDIQNEAEINSFIQKVVKKRGTIDYVLHSVAFGNHKILCTKLPFSDEAATNDLDIPFDDLVEAIDISAYSLLRICRVVQPF